MAIAAVQWSAPFLFAAPVAIAMAYTMRGEAIEILLWAVVGAFLAAQMSRATMIAAQITWRFARPPRAWATRTMAQARSVHLGVRLQFLCMLTASAAIWSWVLFELVPAAKGGVEVATVAAVAGLLRARRRHRARDGVSACALGAEYVPGVGGRGTRRRRVGEALRTLAVVLPQIS